MGDNMVFDKDEALRLVDGEEEFLKELIGVFINETPEHISNIREAVYSRNSKYLEKSAHKLKGAVINFGENATFETALKLEIMGKENRLDKIEEVFGTLRRDIEKLIRALSEFVSN